MYEHPMKRAGLSFSRILFSNMKAVEEGFPKANQKYYKFSFNHKFSDAVKYTKITHYTEKDLDQLFPSTKKEN